MGRHNHENDMVIPGVSGLQLGDANINSFVRELGKSEKVAEAKVARMPLNFASTGNLSGSTANPRLEKAQASQFEVEVVFKPGVMVTGTLGASVRSSAAMRSSPRNCSCWRRSTTAATSAAGWPATARRISSVPLGEHSSTATPAES